MSFTDVESPEMRYEYGWVFISIVCVYAAVHFYLIAKDTYLKVRKEIRKRKYIYRRNKKIKKIIKQE